MRFRLYIPYQQNHAVRDIWGEEWEVLNHPYAVQVKTANKVSKLEANAKVGVTESRHRIVRVPAGIID